MDSPPNQREIPRPIKRLSGYTLEVIKEYFPRGSASTIFLTDNVVQPRDSALRTLENSFIWDLCADLHHRCRICSIIIYLVPISFPLPEIAATFQCTLAREEEEEMLGKKKREQKEKDNRNGRGSSEA